MALRKIITDCRAFSLIELAVALVVVGLMAGVVMQTQHATGPSHCYGQTQAQLANIRTAIDSFARKNNYLPVPAGRALGVTNLKYGNETNMTTDSANIDVIANGGNPVLIGALPFQALGLNASFAADCWGNKFTYAVTQAMTTTAGFTSETVDGVITVRSGTLAGSTMLIGNAAYVVISHGETGIQPGDCGVARNYTGSDHHWLTAAPTVGTSPTDSQNCASVITNNATFFSSVFNNGKGVGNAFFDDVVIFSGKPGTSCSTISSVTWTIGGNTCTGTVVVPPGLSTTTTTSVSNITSGYTGTANVTCFNGVVTTNTTTSTCNVATSAPCKATTVSWLDNGGSGLTCSGLTTNSADGGPPQTITESTPDTGSATWVCNNGTWNITGNGGTCTAPKQGNSCSSAVMTWYDSTAHTQGPCSATFAAMGSDGFTPSTANVATGFTGAAVAECKGGSWVGSPVGTCVPANTGCPTQVLTWMGVAGPCSATFSSIPIGTTSLPTANTAPGFTGRATATCNQGSGQGGGGNNNVAGGGGGGGSTGTWGPATGTCLVAPPSCTPQTLSWTDGSTGLTCSAVFSIVPGTSMSAMTMNSLLPDPTYPYAGAAQASCTGTTWGTPVGNCLTGRDRVACSGAFLPWTDPLTGFTCHANFIPTMQGLATSPTPAVEPTMAGSARAICTLSGAWGAVVGTCAPIPTGSCVPGPLSWTDPWTGQTCSANFPNVLDGATSPSILNTATGFSGRATASCAAGVWSPAMGTCTTVPMTNGVCGTAPGSCVSGVAAAPTDAGPNFTWTCAGSGSGTTATCSIPVCFQDTYTVQIWSPIHAFPVNTSCMGNFPRIFAGQAFYTANVASGWTGAASGVCAYAGSIGSPQWGTSESETCIPDAPADCAAADGVPWGPFSSCHGSFPAVADGSTSSTPSTNVTPGFVGSATASCYHGVLTATGSCTTVPAVNGACGSSYGLCDAGTAVLGENDSTAQAWNCVGSGTGATDYCVTCPGRTGDSWGSGCTSAIPAVSAPNGGYSLGYANSTGTETGRATMKCMGNGTGGAVGWTGTIESGWTCTP